MNPVNKANEITAEYGTFDCKAFRDRVFSRHSPLAIALAYQYRRQAQKRSYVEANQQLLACDNFLTMGERGNGLSVYSDDEQVRAFATLKADQFKKRFFDSFDRLQYQEQRSLYAIRLCRKELAQYGLEFPLKNWRTASIEEIGKAVSRVFDPQWSQ